MTLTTIAVRQAKVAFCVIALSLLVGIAVANEQAKDTDAAATKPFKLGDLIESFTPPSLAELDKTAHWIDNPVLNGMEIQRKKQAAGRPPAVSVAEALRLRNDGPENNAKILGTLGRLAPKTTPASTSTQSSSATPAPI